MGSTCRDRRRRDQGGRRSCALQFGQGGPDSLAQQVGLIEQDSWALGGQQEHGSLPSLAGSKTPWPLGSCGGRPILRCRAALSSLWACLCPPPLQPLRAAAGAGRHVLCAHRPGRQVGGSGHGACCRFAAAQARRAVPRWPMLHCSVVSGCPVWPAVLPTVCNATVVPAPTGTRLRCRST